MAELTEQERACAEFYTAHVLAYWQQVSRSVLPDIETLAAWDREWAERERLEREQGDG